MHGRTVYSKVQWRCEEVRQFRDSYWEIRASVSVFKVEIAGVERGLYRLRPVNTYTAQVELYCRDVMELALLGVGVSHERLVIKGLMIDKIEELQHILNNFMRGTSA